MNAPPATKPKTHRVAVGTGASNKVGVLNINNTVRLNSTGKHIVELASFYPKAHEVYVTSGMDGDHGPRPNGSYHYGHLMFRGSPTAAIDFGALDHANGEGHARTRPRPAGLEHETPAPGPVVNLRPTPRSAAWQGLYQKRGQRAPPSAPAPDPHPRTGAPRALPRARAQAARPRVKEKKPP